MKYTFLTLLYWAIWIGFIYIGILLAFYIIMALEIHGASTAAGICALFGLLFGALGFIVIMWMSEKIDKRLNL